MERANLADRFLSPQPYQIRPAHSGDHDAVMHLLQSAYHVHVHADWRLPTEWIGLPESVVFEERGRLQGYLVATQMPPTVAWVRVLGVAKFVPTFVARKLFEQVEPLLSAAGVRELGCLGSQQWVDDLLPKLGFEQIQMIQTFIKADLEIPAQRKSEVKVRGVVSADFPPLAHLEERTFPDPLWRYSAEQLQRAADHAATFTIAELHGKIVGYQLSTVHHDKIAHLVRMTVDPDCHGQGIGSVLLADALRFYQQAKMHRASLNTQIDNAGARRLYEKFGFRPIGKQYPVWSKQM